MMSERVSHFSLVARGVARRDPRRGTMERAPLMKGLSLFRAQARSERTSIEPMRKRASTQSRLSCHVSSPMFSLLTSRLFSRRASRLFTHLPRQSLLSRHSSLVSALSSLAPHLFSHETTHKNMRDLMISLPRDLMISLPPSLLDDLITS